MFWIALVIGGAALGLSQRYFGTLLHGYDVQFYYAQAHSLVFDRDLDVSNNIVQTPHSKSLDRDAQRDFAALPRRDDGRVINKYPVGLSLVETPLLALGNLMRRGAEAAGAEYAEPPGYSNLEINTVAVGLLVIACGGLQLLERQVRRYVAAPWSIACVGAMWWGTSLAHYTTIYPLMAHGVGFTLAVVVLSFGQRLCAEQPRAGDWMGLALASFALYLTRPQVVLLSLCVVAAVLVTHCRRSLRERASLLAGGTLAAIAIAAAVLFQSAINAQHLGGWYVNAYAQNDEGFAWLAPQFSVVLTSAGRGLLIYSPVVLIALAGFLVTRPTRDLAIPYAALASAVAQIYIVAAWSSPEQGDSFGMRMFCEASPAVGFGLALLWKRAASRTSKTIVAGLVAACVTWTSVLEVAYVKATIPADLSFGELRERI